MRIEVRERSTGGAFVGETELRPNEPTWMDAAERVYNEARGHDGSEGGGKRRRVLASQRQEGGLTGPYATYAVVMGWYDEAGIRYHYDHPLTVEVRR